MWRSRKITPFYDITMLGGNSSDTSFEEGNGAHESHMDKVFPVDGP